MADWKYVLDVKDLLDWPGSPEGHRLDDFSDENVARIADLVYGRLQGARDDIDSVFRRTLPDSRVREQAIHDYDDIADEFHSIKVVDEPGKYRWFDSLMEELYDWADDHRVWIGP